MPHLKVRVSFPDRCKGCGLCAHFCPKGVLIVGRRRNARGWRVVEVIAYERCTGCGICYLMCPDVVLEVKP